MKKWEKFEVDYLIKNYEEYSLETFSEVLSRTTKAISKKAKKIGLIKTNRITKKYEKNNLKKIILLCKSYTEVIRKLGVKTGGGNYETLKKYINKYQLDTSHFIGEDDRIKALRFNNRKSNEEVFIRNSTYSRKNLKKRIIDDNLITYVCDECNNDGKWKNKELTLQLDHINGINDDNRIKNLRFLCPNCHSQTPTYSGKNNTYGIVARCQA